MALKGGVSDKTKSYSEKRRGGRNRTAAPVNEEKLVDKPLTGEGADGEAAKTGADRNKPATDTKKSTDHNLRQEKGAELQQEAGADLTTKNRLQEKPGIGETVGNLPIYGNGIKDQKKYRKHAAKVKEYAQPYVSPLVDEPTSAEKTEPDKVEDVLVEVDGGGAGRLVDETDKTKPHEKKLTEKSSKLEHKESVPTLKSSADTQKLKTEPKKTLKDEGSRYSKVKEDIAEAPVTVDKPPRADSTPRKGTTPTESKLKPDNSKLTASKDSKLETESPSKLTDDTHDSPLQSTASVDKVIDSMESPATSPTEKTQKDTNRKKQYGEAHGQDGKPPRFINTSKSPKSVAYQHKLHDQADKLTEKGSKLRERQAANIETMPTKTVTTTERVYDEATGKVSKLKNIEKRTLHQNETRWNNPKFTDRLKNAEGAKEKGKVIAEAVGKKGAVLGTAAAVGGTPAVAGALVAKPAVEYGSKLLVTAAHRQVRKDIRQNGDNEVLKAAHWAEQKGERALGQGIRKLNPMSIRRYVKNAPYRRESKLRVKELKNDKKLGLLRVKQDKATGINHMTGKKSNPIARAWQKRQIKKNYQRAMMAVNGKGGGGTLSAMAREVARGNPKAILTLAAKKIAIIAAKLVFKKVAVLAAKVAAKILLNPIFWKVMAVVLIFVVILLSVQACVAIFSPGAAGFGVVSDEDKEFSTRIYSEWETDMAVFVRDLNITDEFPPPAHITSQPGVNGVVVYPAYPYTPPPPFYEYRFEIGMISHDPMELISYLTARHGERFDEDSANPMTRNTLEAILLEIFEEQYGIPPGEFDDLIQTEEETRFRRERRWEQTGTQPVIIGTAPDGSPIWGTAPIYGYVYHDIYYQFWILTVTLEPRSLSDVLRNRMTEDEEIHFDVLNLTGNGRQVVGNPFDFNWLPFITSHYGYRVHPISNTKQMHMGIDIGLPLGTPIFATHTGTITQVQFSDTGYGNMIRLRGEGADEIIYEILFAHLHEIHVTQGQDVEQGDLIATVGTSGDSTGPHLHLEVYRPAQTAIINGSNVNLTAMRLNPIFAVITWTDEQGNEIFRPEPGAGGLWQPNPPFIPAIPPQAMSDERFVAILTEASRHLGARYVWGGQGPSTFDCSGFIHWVFTNAGIGWTHGRTTAQGYFNMSTPVSAENARSGDLVFFHGTHSGAFITHVGIYIGNGQMIHTGGNPAGVEFVNINSPFWQRHFHAFGRV